MLFRSLGKKCRMKWSPVGVLQFETMDCSRNSYIVCRLGNIISPALKVFYEFLLEHPDWLKRFNTAMMTLEAALSVLGIFPFALLLEKCRSEGRAFIVDAAGGRGQSLL